MEVSSCEALIIAMMDDDYAWLVVGMFLGVPLTLLTQIFIRDFVNRG